jgi:hypothetical protein
VDANAISCYVYITVCFQIFWSASRILQESETDYATLIDSAKVGPDGSCIWRCTKKTETKC